MINPKREHPTLIQRVRWGLEHVQWRVKCVDKTDHNGRRIYPQATSHPFRFEVRGDGVTFDVLHRGDEVGVGRCDTEDSGRLRCTLTANNDRNLAKMRGAASVLPYWWGVDVNGETDESK